MQKKNWSITLLATGFMIFFFLGITSVQAAESVAISDLLNDPSAFEGVEVEVTGTVVGIDYGLILEDSSGAQLLISAGPLWYLSSTEVGLDLEVGDTITVVGIVCTVPGPQNQNNVHLAAFEIDGIPIRDGVGVQPTWAGGQTRQHCGQPQNGGQYPSYGHHQNRGQTRMRADVAAGLCGGGSLTGLAGYGLRRV